MDLQNIMDNNASDALPPTLKHKPRKNACIVCGICETCGLYVTKLNSHRCQNKRPEKDFIYKKFNTAEEKDSFAKFVEINFFWDYEVDFDEDFYYCLCKNCYQDAIGKKQKILFYFYILLTYIFYRFW